MLDEDKLLFGASIICWVISDNLSIARKNIHLNLEKLNWKKGFYRKDIAFKVIKQ